MYSPVCCRKGGGERGEQRHHVRPKSNVELRHDLSTDIQLWSRKEGIRCWTLDPKEGKKEDMKVPGGDEGKKTSTSSCHGIHLTLIDLAFIHPAFIHLPFFVTIASKRHKDAGFQLQSLTHRRSPDFISHTFPSSIFGNS
jgi:hypothetical protein